jgi:nitroreductase
MNVEIAPYVGIFDSIKRRRSIGQMTQQQPTREQIERILEAATYAPNHYVTEPWQFFILTGAAREELGRVMAEALEARLADASSQRAQAMLATERRKPLRAPVIIAVTIPGLRYLQGVEIENIEAGAAAVQNMLLTAEEMGLATIWRTGEAAYDPHIKQWFGLAPEDHIVAFIYLGYPAVSRPARVPTPFTVKTTWLS